MASRGSCILICMNVYYSKLLLFGEYTIISGGQALALPLSRFSCRWTQLGSGMDSKTALRHFFSYLQQLDAQNWLKGVLDLEQFATDLNNGFFLESNIPTGYGLGSSGALCAAVYDRYALDKFDRNAREHYVELRNILGLMESHFHGASSGVDPLICYLNQPVLIRTGAEIECVSAALPAEDSPIQFFLLDTGMSRQTGPLVEYFLKKCESRSYARRIENELIPYTEAIIESFLHGHWADVYGRMHVISHFQWEHFDHMIPDAFKAVWQEGLDGDYFKLKLCGAGGGGFLLGWTNNRSEVEKQLESKFKLIWLV